MRQQKVSKKCLPLRGACLLSLFPSSNTTSLITSHYLSIPALCGSFTQWFTSGKVRAGRIIPALSEKPLQNEIFLPATGTALQARASVQ
jgi:hypothetical protein